MSCFQTLENIRRKVPMLGKEVAILAKGLLLL